MVEPRSMLLVAIAALTLGCSDSGGGGRPDDVQPGFIVWTEPIPDRLGARVAGVVHVADNGCVYVASSSGAEREPAIWPFGTTFDGTVIRTADGVEIRGGDSVEGSGGAVEYEYDYYVENTTLSVDLDLLRACGEIEGDRILAFNPTQPIVLATE
jgi:hypothetical protein